MNKNQKQSTPPKVNKALYAVTVALLFVVAVIIALLGSAGSRGTPGTTEPDTTLSTKLPSDIGTSDTYRNDTTSPAPSTERPKETTKVPEESKKPVVAPAPTLILPASGILTKAHSMDLQVYSQTMGDYRVHCGIDISTAPGEAVLAAADGKISEITEDPLYGITIAVTHSGGLTTYYKNLAEDLPEGLEAGDTVKCGEIIGAVGDSAMVEIAEEPHLHFEVYSSGEAVDPLEYLDEAALVSLSVPSVEES